MNKEDKFGELKTQMRHYSETRFATVEEEERANKQIKMGLLEFIIESHSIDSTSPNISAALKLIFDSTGCMEDVVIAREILDILQDKGILTLNESIAWMKTAPVNRWY